MDGPGLLAPWNAALAGMAEPWVVCTVLAATTLLVEDVAIAAGAAVAAAGLLSWGASFAAVAGGIAAGDLGLYALGALARRWPALAARVLPREARWRAPLAGRLGAAVLLARVIPGLRLVTYTACGLLRLPLAPFAAWVGLAVVLWTAGLYLFAAAAGAALVRALGVPPAVAVAVPVVLLALAVPLVRAAQRRLRRRRPSTEGMPS